MPPPDVLWCARTAGYQAVHPPYQFLTDHGLTSFRADEALLRGGDALHRRQLLNAQVQARWLVICLAHPDEVSISWLEESWQAFDDRPARRFLLVPGEFPVEQLPDDFRNSLTFFQDGPWEEMLQLISGQVRRSAGTGTGVSLPALTPPGPSTPSWERWAVAAGLALLISTAAWFSGAGAWLMPSSGLARHNAPEPTAAPPDSPHPGLTSAEMISLWQADPDSGIHQIKIGQEVQLFSWISPGRFNMGSPATELNRRDDEIFRPVEIRHGFWMARTECTQAFWEEVMGGNPSQFHQPDGPVESVSWEDVAGRGPSFLTKINSLGLLPDGLLFALPDEMQWEYACRAGTTGPFSIRGILPGYLANTDGRLPYGPQAPGLFLNRITDVGSYQPNAWNLYDMHGNVQEWCASSGEGLHPNPAPGTLRPVRGGSWRYSPSQSRSAARLTLRGDVGDDTTGFRLAVVAN